MEKQGTIRISQCMIVKNEEDNIKEALSWGKEVVWEQIVVDTGSTDRTVESAESMGAVVYQFPWIDDFAAAKNFAIDKARGNWIAFLDADETFAPGDEKKLVQILKQLDHTETDGVSAGWMQLDHEGKVTAAGTQIRIFRSREGLRYQRRIHEQLGWTDGSPMRIADATQELSILHRGYCGERWEEKKVSDRNLRLILKELEEHPKDHEMMGYLGDEYYAAGKLDEAETWYRESIASMPEVLDRRDQRSAATFLYLMQILEANQADSGEIRAVYERAVSLLPQEADFDYILGMHDSAQGAWEDGTAHLEQALGKLERYGTDNRAMLTAGHLQETYEQLARCYLFTGKYEKAVSSSVTILKAEPYSMEALCILMKAFYGGNGRPPVPAADACRFMERLYPSDSLKSRLFLLKAASLTGWEELKDWIEKKFTAEELAFIHKM